MHQAFESPLTVDPVPGLRSGHLLHPYPEQFGGEPLRRALQPPHQEAEGGVGQRVDQVAAVPQTVLARRAVVGALTQLKLVADPAVQAEALQRHGRRTLLLGELCQRGEDGQWGTLGSVCSFPTGNERRSFPVGNMVMFVPVTKAFPRGEPFVRFPREFRDFTSGSVLCDIPHRVRGNRIGDR